MLAVSVDGDARPGGSPAPRAAGGAVALAARVAAESPLARRRRAAVPGGWALARAGAWLAGRAGRTAFAVVDTRGRLRGVRTHERFHSASLVKAMLLVAELRRLDAQGATVGAADRLLLDAMIRVSDNDAASAVFARVGQEGLLELAGAAGMTDFAPAAAWGLSEISAADQARFFAGQDALLPPRFRPFARGLLSGIVPEQSWGIPAAARPAGFEVYFKGGWLWGIVNQAARLESADCTFALAVLTDGNPSMAYGQETLAGVTAQLVGGVW